MLEKLTSRLRRFGSAWLNFSLFNTLWVLGAAVLIYGIYLYMVNEVPNATRDNTGAFLFAEIVKELSTALFIAYIIGFSTEYWAVRRQEAHRSQMLTEISKNVYQAVYSRDLPPEVFLEVKKRILEASFLRRKFHVEVILQRYEPAEKAAEATPLLYGSRAQVTLRQRFEMHNITEDSQDWESTLQVDRRVYAQINDAGNHFIDFSVEIFDNNGASLRVEKFARQAIERERVKEILPLVDNSDPRYQTLRMIVTIPRGGRACVDTRYEQIHPLDGADALCCTHPATGLTLTVVVPRGDFVVEAMSMHPASEVDLSRSDNAYLRNFEIQQALLPGQGIYYRWYPIKGV